jgi:hypothetical protein
MRRLIAISVLLVGASITAGCTSSSTPTATSPTTASNQAAAVSNTAVCAQLKTVVASDLGPLGAAFGTLVGDATAKNKTGQHKAETTATTALAKLGTDLESAAAAGDDPAVRTAVTTTQQNLTTLVGDPSFLSDITTMDGIATATTKLQAATAPITTACQGS